MRCIFGRRIGKSNKIDEVSTNDKQEVKEPIIFRRIIENKLYDTSKAKLVCGKWSYWKCLKEYMQMPAIVFGDTVWVDLYKATTEWFIVVDGGIYRVDEEFVKNYLSYEPEKYIEYFGKVELA